MPLRLLSPGPSAPGYWIVARCSSYSRSTIQFAADASWIAVGMIVVGLCVVAVVVVVLTAEVWTMVVVLLVELVVGIPDIGFELCGVEDLAPKQTLHYSADSELDCGADSDCYYTDSISSGGTDETSC